MGSWLRIIGMAALALAEPALAGVRGRPDWREVDAYSPRDSRGAVQECVLRRILATGSGDGVFAIGKAGEFNNDQAPAFVRRSRNGGRSFDTPLEVREAGRDCFLSGLRANAFGHVFAGGYCQPHALSDSSSVLLFRSKDGGATWDRWAAPSAPGFVADVDFALGPDLPALLVVTLGTAGSTSPRGYAVFRADEFGENWRETERRQLGPVAPGSAEAPPGAYQIERAPDGTWILGGRTGDFVEFRRGPPTAVDAWTVLGSFFASSPGLASEGGRLFSLDPRSGSLLAFDGEGGRPLLRRSADGGRSWTQVTLAPPGADGESDLPVDVAFTSETQAFVARLVEGGPLGGAAWAVSRSEDGGRTWREDLRLRRRGAARTVPTAISAAPGGVYVAGHADEKTCLIQYRAASGSR